MRPLILKSLAIFLLGIVLFHACRSSDMLPSDHVKLGVNKPARLASGLTVSVDTLTDGRCPEGYNCIAAGWATASVTISYETDFQKRKIQTGAFGKYRPDSTTVQFQSIMYKVILRDVVPYPVRNERPEQQAIIQVSRL